MNSTKINHKKSLIPGSKVPIAYLLDYLKENYSISEFVTSYPWIKEENVKKALDEIKTREFSMKHAL